MKYAVIGDIHGRTLNGFEDYLEEENPDKVYCTGDFDLLDSYKQFLDITEDFDTAIVPANHEHAIRDGLDIMSRSMDEIGVDVSDLKDQWEGTRYYSFIEKVDNQASYTEEFSLDGREAIIIHAALDGDSSFYRDCSADKEKLWNRLSEGDDQLINSSSTHHLANFEKMEKQGYEVMFRSHDHEPEVTYRDSDRGIVSLKPEQDGDRFGLREDKMYTVTTGAWYDGWFLSIETDSDDTDYPMLRYHKGSI